MPPRPALDELVEEFLFRLPPDDPAGLVRASAVCKPWRRILADPGFRRRYREFHGAPPILGFFDDDATFVPTLAFLPSLPDSPRPPRSISLDCRHGRVLLTVKSKDHSNCDLAVLDPLTGYQCRVPLPVEARLNFFSAAVLCAVQGCDHLGCQGGSFHVVLVKTNCLDRVTYGWLYSSETLAWTDLTSVHHPNIHGSSCFAQTSLLVGDDLLYFNGNQIIQCQLGTRCLSIFEKPLPLDGRLMKTRDDGGLTFATVVFGTNLAMWSAETGPEGAVGWANRRVIDLMTLLPDAVFSTPTPRWNDAYLSGFAEGTQVIFVSTSAAGVYMVDLTSRRVRKVSPDSGHDQTCYPYMNFYIPAMEAASTSQGQ